MTSMTLVEGNKIEMVQKKAFAIILGRNYHSYATALSSLQQERLDARREELSFKFALKINQTPVNVPT